MPALLRNPHRLPLLTVTIKRRECDRCRKRASILVLPNYHYQEDARWCPTCVRQWYAD